MTLADPLCGSLCDLCVSVVSVFVRIFTTETQRTTEIAQRNRYPARADDFFSSLLGHQMDYGLDMMRLWEHVKGGDGGEAITAGNQFFQIAGECGWVAGDVSDSVGL